MKSEEQIEGQYQAIQKRINELEPGKLRAYNDLLAKVNMGFFRASLTLSSPRCALMYHVPPPLLLLSSAPSSSSSSSSLRPPCQQRELQDRLAHGDHRLAGTPEDPH
jgi:hypothetical protein